MFNIVFNRMKDISLCMGGWGVLMIVTRKIYFAFNNKMFRSTLQ